MITYEAMIGPALWAAGIGATLTAAVLVVRGRLSRRTVAYALAATLLIPPAVGVVPAGSRGVVYQLGGGVQSGERGEGVTLLVPWIQHLIPTTVRTQKVFSDSVFSQSSDLQEITVVASVNYHVDPQQAAELYQSVGPDYEAKVIRPALFQRTKSAVGQIRAEDFAVNRTVLSEQILGGLTEQLKQYGIVVEYVNIEDAIFDPDFITSVKEKVVAEQEAQEQQNLVAARRAEREQAIIKAEGTAEANRKIAESLTPSLISWLFLERWDGQLPTTLLTGGGPDSASFILDLGSAAAGGSG